MRSTSILAGLLSILMLAACGGIETRPEATDTFTAGNYQFYQWRNPPMENTINSTDPIYTMDPMVRRSIDAELQKKGYVLDENRAQFSVDYLYAPGLMQGEVSRDASNLNPYPTAIPNRQRDQASVDNAYALGGMKETDNIAVQFNDLETHQEVWRVVITKIVEDANNIDTSRMQGNLNKAIGQGFKALPKFE
jgi:hypothetical protein